MIAAVNLARAVKVALEGEPRQLGHFRWDFVGNDGDDAAAAEGDERERDGVVAGEDDEVFWDGVEDRGHLRDIARSFLDANNIFNFGEALYRGGLDVYTGAALHAVENDGQGHRFGDGTVVLEEALLSGLVVIRSDREDAIHAEVNKLASEGDHFGSIVAARAPEDWHFALGQFDGDLNNSKMLLVRERGAFARGSTRNEEVDACLDLPLD